MQAWPMKREENGKGCAEASKDEKGTYNYRPIHVLLVTTHR